MKADSGKKHTVESMRMIQTDYKSYTFDMLHDILAATCSQAGRGSGGGDGGVGSGGALGGGEGSMMTSQTSSQVAQACVQLLKWDGVMGVGSKEATLFARWFVELTKLASNETGTMFWKDVVYLRLRLAQECKPPLKTDAIDREPGYYASGLGTNCAFSLAALRQAAVQSSFTEGWGEGELHAAKFVHQVLDASIAKCAADRTTPHGGDEHTVNVGHWDFSDAAMTQTAGPVHQTIPPHEHSVSSSRGLWIDGANSHWSTLISSR